MTQQPTKPYKGAGMKGFIARWYARTTRNEIDCFRREALEIAARVPKGAAILEVAPGPGYFSIELAKLGPFHVTGLDISPTFVQIAQANAREQSVKIDFYEGNASAMPFAAEVFDFIYCRAAFKNFSQPLEAINEMHRVLRPGGRAMIMDLRKDVSPKQIDSFVRSSGRNFLDALLTKLVFRFMLTKRAYTTANFLEMAEKSRFGSCQVEAEDLALKIHFMK